MLSATMLALLLTTWLLLWTRARPALNSSSFQFDGHLFHCATPDGDLVYSLERKKIRKAYLGRFGVDSVRNK